MSTQVLTRVFDIFGDVRSPKGWVPGVEHRAIALTDVQAVARFRTGVTNMKVKKIVVGKQVIWRKS